MRMDKYDCGEAFSRLDDYLDRELSEIELTLVSEHLEICEMCAREFVFERNVIVCLRMKLMHISAPPQLLSKIKNALPPNPA